MADYNAFGLVDNKELLTFAQNLNTTRNWLGSKLFPDRKVQYIDAEYSRLIRNGNLPQIAMVHAFDTEAHIASRLTWEKATIEQLLIKEKINQTEALTKYRNQIDTDAIINYVFDDAARLFEAVLTRAEKAKIDAMTLGKFVIKENNLNFEVDYGIPRENFVQTKWDENADILNDIITWSDKAEENGAVPDRAFTTRKVLRIIQRNKKIQKQIGGVNGEGILPTIAQINALLQDQAGITITVDEDVYGVATYDKKGKVTMARKKFFPEDTFIMTPTNNTGSIGIGLWGVTPEEEAISGTFTSASERQFVTITQWSSEDPVAVWTKATGLFVPVLPEVYSHIVADVNHQD